MSDLSVKIQAETGEFNKAVREAQGMLKVFSNEQSAAAETMRKVYDVSQDQVNAFKKSAEAIAKATNGTKTNKQASAALAKEVEKLRQQFNNLSDTAKKSAFGRNLSNTIRESENKIKSFNAEIANTNRNLQQTGAGGFSAIGNAISSQVPIVGNLAAQFTKLHPAILAVAGVGKVLADSFATSESAMDSARRTMSGLQNAYNDFVKGIRDGEIGDLFGGFMRGKNIYDAEDSFGSLMANNKAAYDKIKNQIDEARLKVTGGGSLSSAEIVDLSNAVGDQYNEILASKNEVLKAKIAAAAAGSKEKEQLIKEYLQSDNANQLLEKMKVDRKTLLQERGTLKTEGYNFEEGYWTDKTKKAAYEIADAQYKTLNSIIESETELQTLQEINAEIFALDRERIAAMRDVTKIANKAVQNDKTAATEKQKAQEAEIKRQEAANKAVRDALKLREKEANLVKDISPAAVGVNATNYAPEIDERQFANDKRQLQIDLLRESLPDVRENIGTLSSLNGGLQSIYNTMQNISNLDNPFDFFSGLLSVAQNMLNVRDSMQKIGQAVKSLGAINKLEAQQEIALSGQKASASGVEAAADATAGSAKAMKAHAAIPWVGVAIGAAMVATLVGVIAATKNKVPKFANGGILTGPQLLLAGEYAGAANNPEVITPLDKLRGMLADVGGGGFGQVEFVQRGNDLYGVIKRVEHLNSRR